MKGWWTIPNTARPERVRAIKVPHAGMPEMNDLVPSIGSSIHTNSAPLRSAPNSSPMIPWAGNFSRINVRIACSAARSAAVTGSNAPPQLLSSTPSEVRKNGLMTSPDTVASSPTKASKSTAVMRSYPGWGIVPWGHSNVTRLDPRPSRQGEASAARSKPHPAPWAPPSPCPWRREGRERAEAQKRKFENRLTNYDLPLAFCAVRCQVFPRAVAPPALPPPSLGVSSLDLGRWAASGLFLFPACPPAEASFPSGTRGLGDRSIELHDKPCELRIAAAGDWVLNFVRRDALVAARQHSLPLPGMGVSSLDWVTGYSGDPFSFRRPAPASYPAPDAREP